MEFLKTHKDVALATVEGDRPKIRVFQIMLQEGATLYFATSAKKEVYRQLQQNQNVELLAMDVQGNGVFPSACHSCRLL